MEASTGCCIHMPGPPGRILSAEEVAVDDARLLKNVTAREKYKESVGGTLHPGITRAPLA